MNLTDLDTTPLPAALEAARAAAEHGAKVEWTELVGLAPLGAILQTTRHYLALRDLEEKHILEAKLWDAGKG